MGQCMACCVVGEGEFENQDNSKKIKQRLNKQTIPSVIQEEDSKYGASNSDAQTRKLTFRSHHDESTPPPQQTMNTNSFKSLGSVQALQTFGARVAIINRSSGLCLKSHLLKNKTIIRAYDVTLSNYDQKGYQDWIFSNEIDDGLEVVRLEHAITNLKLCAVQNRQTNQMEICCKRGKQTDSSDLWLIELIINEQGKASVFFNIVHCRSLTYLTCDVSNRDNLAPALITQSDINTVWRVKQSE